MRKFEGSQIGKLTIVLQANWERFNYSNKGVICMMLADVKLFHYDINLNSISLKLFSFPDFRLLGIRRRNDGNVATPNFTNAVVTQVNNGKVI